MYLQHCQYSQVILQVDGLAHQNGDQGTHQLKGEGILLELEGEQVEALHDKEVGLEAVARSLEKRIQHLQM